MIFLLIKYYFVSWVVMRFIPHPYLSVERNLNITMWCAGVVLEMLTWIRKGPQNETEEMGFDNLYDLDHNGNFSLNIERAKKSEAFKKRVNEIAEDMNKIKLEHDNGK
jgi:hypothetical protein